MTDSELRVMTTVKDLAAKDRWDTAKEYIFSTLSFEP